MVRCRPGIVPNSERERFRISGAPFRAKRSTLHRIRDAKGVNYGCRKT
jgi:hypothetical protein